MCLLIQYFLRFPLRSHQKLCQIHHSLEVLRRFPVVWYENNITTYVHMYCLQTGLHYFPTYMKVCTGYVLSMYSIFLITPIHQKSLVTSELQCTLVIVNAWIVNNLSLVNIFGETGRFFYNINYMLNSEHLSLVNKIGDKTEFTITRVHCTSKSTISEKEAVIDIFSAIKKYNFWKRGYNRYIFGYLTNSLTGHR